MTNLALPIVHSPLSPQEAENLRTQVQDAGPLFRTILSLMLTCGLRRGELLALRLDDFRGDSISISGRREGMRELPCPQAIQGDIKTLLATQDGNHLLLGPTHLAICMRKIRQAACSAGINKPITCSGLRRTCLTHLAHSGMDRFMLAHFAGHRSVHSGPPSLSLMFCLGLAQEANQASFD